ncbi:MAG: hypothetical protein ACLFVJ_18400 [Persicimonas sp.]
MNDSPDIDLPDLNHGFIDEATLEQYFADLEHAEVFGVVVKGAPERYAGDENLEFSTGKKLFEDRQVLGLQIRYLWEDKEWWDTLLRTPEGTKLVRIQHEWDESQKDNDQ